MIKILHLTSSFGLGGGAEANLLRLVSNMDRARFRNTIVTMTEGVQHESLFTDLTRSGISVHSLKMCRGIPNLAATVQLFNIIRRTRPQILQTWMYHADLLGTLVGKLARVPFLAWNLRCSSLSINDERRRSKFIVQILAKLSWFPGVILANSQAGIQFHRSVGYSPHRWLYIPNSLDTIAFRPDLNAAAWLRTELRLNPEARLVGLIARFHPSKDHITFIEAARELAVDEPTAHFVLAGTGITISNDHLMCLINSTGFPERFHLLGHRTDIGHITAGLDVSCSSSISEGSSNIITEAMACGIPCVVTDVGDSSGVLDKFGRTVPPRDPHTFAQACKELLNLSFEQRHALGLAARVRAEQYFSLPSIVAQYEQLYEDCLSLKNQPSNCYRAPTF